MRLDDLIFVGLNGYVVALHRETGEIIWKNSELHSGYVTLLLDGDRLIASTNGYIYCLEPHTGKIRWHNPLKGFGPGAPSALVSVRGQAPQALMEQMAAQAVAIDRDVDIRRDAGRAGLGLDVLCEKEVVGQEGGGHGQLRLQTRPEMPDEAGVG